MQQNENNKNNLYEFDTITDLEQEQTFGEITGKDKLTIAKQILLGLASIFVLSELIFAIHPEQGAVLLEICKTTLPPLATLIIAFYFKSQ